MHIVCGDIMRSLFIILSLITVLSCGRDSGGNLPSGKASGLNDESKKDYTQTSNAGVEADFAGRVKIESNGDCKIVDGNEVDYTNCSLFSNSQLERVIEVDYTGMNFENAPVCTTSLVTRLDFNHTVSLLTRTKLQIRITPFASNPSGPIQPSVVIPTPVPTRPPYGVCTPAYNGPRCISCCGSTYGEVARVIAEQRTVRYTPSWPDEAVFNCKITD